VIPANAGASKSRKVRPAQSLLYKTNEIEFLSPYIFEMIATQPNTEHCAGSGDKRNATAPQRPAANVVEEEIAAPDQFEPPKKYAQSKAKRAADRKRLEALCREGFSELDNVKLFYSAMRKLEDDYTPKGATEKFMVKLIASFQVAIETAQMMRAEFVTENLNPRVAKTATERARDFFQMIFCADELAKLGASGDRLNRPTIIWKEGFEARISPATVSQLTTIFLRYERSLHADYFRAVRELQRHQGERRRAQAEERAPGNGVKSDRSARVRPNAKRRQKSS
jgi:hypothetical protein